MGKIPANKLEFIADWVSHSLVFIEYHLYYHCNFNFH